MFCADGVKKIVHVLIFISLQHIPLKFEFSQSLAKEHGQPVHEADACDDRDKHQPKPEREEYFVVDDVQRKKTFEITLSKVTSRTGRFEQTSALSGK